LIEAYFINKEGIWNGQEEYRTAFYAHAADAGE
jgi:hypothetical protein